MKTRPFDGDLVGVERDVGERRGAALGRRAERFFQDGGEAAGLVAGRGVVVHLALVAGGVVLPPADAVDQLLADLLRGGAADEQVLGAVDLRRLGEHGGAAILDQHVGGAAERRVGGDAGIAVGAAAFERHHQLARRLVGALDDGQGRQAAPRSCAWPSRWSSACRRSPGWSACGNGPRRSRICAFSRPICMTSQPRPTKIAAVTFGCVAWPQSTRSSASKPSPVSAMPQPVPCESAMTPSMCG